jgi:hypothetical protein
MTKSITTFHAPGRSGATEVTGAPATTTMASATTDVVNHSSQRAHTLSSPTSQRSALSEASMSAAVLRATRRSAMMIRRAADEVRLIATQTEQPAETAAATSQATPNASARVGDC